MLSNISHTSELAKLDAMWLAPILLTLYVQNLPLSKLPQTPENLTKLLHS